MTESQHQNMLFVNSPNQILSQKNCMNMINTDTSPASSTNVSSATARRRPAALTCLYDEYGNRIDGDSYYEYDNTGTMDMPAPAMTTRSKWNVYSTFINKNKIP